jgi:hypothetical protein
MHEHDLAGRRVAEREAEERARVLAGGVQDRGLCAGDLASYPCIGHRGQVWVVCSVVAESARSGHLSRQGREAGGDVSGEEEARGDFLVRQ